MIVNEVCKMIVNEVCKMIVNEVCKMIVKGCLEQDKQADFDRIMKKDLNYLTLVNALKELSEYLHRYHKSKCLVLANRFDTPMCETYSRGYYAEAKEFFGKMFSMLFNIC